MASELTGSGANSEVPATAQGGDGGTSSNGQGLVLKVLGAVGTGIGILGFVTFFGGAILWVRADRAHLPASDAVAVIPSSVLVTTGASFLVPAVLLALFAVALIFAVHLGFDLPRRGRRRALSEEAGEDRFEADQAIRAAEPKVQLAQAARALATTQGEAVERAKQIPGLEGQVQALTSQAEGQRKEAERREAEARAATSEAAEKDAAAANKQADSEHALKRSRVQQDVEIGVGAIVLVVLPPVINGAVYHVGICHGGILILLAVAGAVISLVTYVATDRFIWFGVVAFIAVGVYIGCATYFSTIGNPKVEPAAALRGDRPPVTGVFIADTADNLYLGTFADGRRRPRLLIVPRSQVTDLAVGPLLDPNTARKRATALALDECQQQIAKAKSGTAAASVSRACSKRQQAALSRAP